jgi:hypothetical protein
MNTASPFGAVQDQRDRDHLNLLSVFHYVVAGMGLLGGAFLVVHYLFMNILMNEVVRDQKASPPPQEFFLVMKMLYAVFGVLLGVGILVNVLSALFMRQRRHRVFSMVVAGLNCLQFPFGTVLGVFTFIVLMRESVQALYQAPPRS